MLLKSIVRSNVENSRTMKRLVEEVDSLKRSKHSRKRKRRSNTSCSTSSSDESDVPLKKRADPTKISLKVAPKKHSANLSIHKNPESKKGKTYAPSTSGNVSAKNSLSNSAKGKFISLETYSHEDEFPLSEPEDIEQAMQDDESSILEAGNLSQEEESEEPEDGIDLPLLGCSNSPNWMPTKSYMDWFNKAADVELNSDEIESIAAAYKSSDEIDSHFSPAKLPTSIMPNLTRAETYKQKLMYKAEHSYSLALKPLMTVLPKLTHDKETLSQVTSAIQLICSGNLQLNRLRRSSFTQTLNMNNNLRQSLLSNPVTHQELFGIEFEKALDNAIKANSLKSKLLNSDKSILEKFILQHQEKKTPKIPTSISLRSLNIMSALN